RRGPRASAQCSLAVQSGGSARVLPTLSITQRPALCGYLCLSRQPGPAQARVRCPVRRSSCGCPPAVTGVALSWHAPWPGAVAGRGSRRVCSARSSGARSRRQVPVSEEVAGVDRVIIGVDPHKLSVTLEARDSREILRAKGQFGTDAAGYRQLLAYA